MEQDNVNVEPVVDAVSEGNTPPAAEQASKTIETDNATILLHEDSVDGENLTDEELAATSGAAEAAVEEDSVVDEEGTAETDGDVVVAAEADADEATDVAANSDDDVTAEDASGEDEAPVEDTDGEGDESGATWASLELGSQQDDLTFGSDDADIMLSGQGDDVSFGNGGSDIMIGDQGSDVLFGGDDDDVMLGGQGRDVLFGDDGNDVILGGQGNDLIAGGAGDDQLYGGQGDDTFLFGDGSGSDVIEDFSIGSDQIAISAGINGSDLADAEGVMALVSDNDDGFATIDLGEDNSITISGVSTDDLSESDFSIA